MVGQVVYKGLHLLLGMNLMGMVDNHTLLFVGKRTEALHGFGALCQAMPKPSGKSSMVFPPICISGTSVYGKGAKHEGSGLSKPGYPAKAV